MAPTKKPCISYATSARNDTPRSPCVRRTRSRAAILTGNVPSRLDYRTTAHSGFTASTAPAPLPKAQLRPSPPQRSIRLGSTISLGYLASPRPTPPPSNPQLDLSPFVASSTLHATCPDPDVHAAATHLSSILLSYNHRDWEHTQRENPLCDVTRRYIQPGCPIPLPSTLFDHISSHVWTETADIDDLALKGRWFQGDDDTILLVRKSVAIAPAPVGHRGRPSRPPFNNPVHIHVPLLARPWICTHATLMHPVILMLRAPLKFLNASIGGLV